jgi:thymidylate synthase
MKVFKGDNFSNVYEESLRCLYTNPNYKTSPRGLSIKEDLGVVLEFNNPLNSLYTNKRRSSQFKYIAAEYLWYFLGKNDVDFISKYSSFWKNIQNEDGTVNSAYGNLIFKNKNEHNYTQYKWAIDSLIKDSDSRQAIMHFNSDRHQYASNKDFVCTIYSIFHIRDNKLHFTVKMRSNDAILGLPTDVAFFTMLHQQAFLHLTETYPTLEIGTYSHHIDSYHIYERHFDLVNDMLKHDFLPVSIPKLNNDLISKSGQPSIELIELNRNLNYNQTYSNDVLDWIKNQISNNVTHSL